MPFPSLNPTARSFNPGNWPVKTFNAQSGAEVRILYGDTRTRMEFELTYDNIPDVQAELFLAHYDETKGTYFTFFIPPSARAGWTGTSPPLSLGGSALGNQFRYAEPPQVTAVRLGRSSVRVRLIGVF